LKM
ncbi:putative type III secretion flagellar biosynthesis M-ring protein, partial [Chlamydia psittaci 84-8471/1]|jgi:hypothetical protein